MCSLRPSLFRSQACLLLLLIGLAGSGCGNSVVKETVAEPRISKTAESTTSPADMPMWLGNAARNFYGSGPWPDRPLKVIWEVETKFTTGRLHKDRWRGSSWPGQPAVQGERIYFGSADSYLYCLDSRDGRVIWSFKTEDSLKATPTLAGNRLIASGLDHYVYCLNAEDGSLHLEVQDGLRSRLLRGRCRRPSLFRRRRWLLLLPQSRRWGVGLQDRLARLDGRQFFGG